MSNVDYIDPNRAKELVDELHDFPNQELTARKACRTYVKSPTEGNRVVALAALNLLPLQRRILISQMSYPR